MANFISLSEYCTCARNCWYLGGIKKYLVLVFSHKKNENSSKFYKTFYITAVIEVIPRFTTKFRAVN